MHCANVGIPCPPYRRRIEIVLERMSQDGLIVKKEEEMD